jgi:hypothetical protein
MCNIEQLQLLVSAQNPLAVLGRGPMTHKGVEYSVVTTATPGVWKWQFRIGDTIKSGKTETRINLLAIRRVQLRIDRELKKAARNPTP